MLVNTFLDTRLAVGRLWYIRGYGRVRPTAKKKLMLKFVLDKVASLTCYSNWGNDEKVNVKELEER